MEDLSFKIINVVVVEMESLTPQISKSSFERGPEPLPPTSLPQNLLLYPLLSSIWLLFKKSSPA
jgi:hypothetical protein